MEMQLYDYILSSVLLFYSEEGILSVYTGASTEHCQQILVPDLYRKYQILNVQINLLRGLFFNHWTMYISYKILDHKCLYTSQYQQVHASNAIKIERKRKQNHTCRISRRPIDKNDTIA